MATNNSSNIVNVTSGAALPLVKIGTYTASGASLQAADVFNSSLYSAYRIVVSNCLPATTDDNNFLIRVAASGTSWNTSGIYSFRGHYFSDDGDGTSYVGRNQTSIQLTSNRGVDTAADQGYNGIIDLNGGVLNTSYPNFGFNGIWNGQGTTTTRQANGGAFAKISGGQTRSIQFLWASGANFAAGSMVIYGYSI